MKKIKKYVVIISEEMYELFISRYGKEYTESNFTTRISMKGEEGFLTLIL